MDKNDIIEVLQAFSSSNATQLDYKQGETVLKLSKLKEIGVSSAVNGAQPVTADQSVTVVNPPEKAVTPLEAAPVVTAVSATVAPTAVPIAGDTTWVKSPLVGVCYTSPTPDSPDFVTIGDQVAAGDTLCIIEAMKVMNEIKAPKAGKVVAIPIQSGDVVAFDQLLVEIE